MRFNRYLVTLVIAVTYLLCSRAQGQEQATTQESKIPPVVARVNGRDLSAEQYRDMWHILHKARRQVDPRTTMGPGYTESMKKQVLDRLITLELLSQKADESNIYVDPKEVEGKLAEMKAMRMRGSFGILDTMNVPEPEWDDYRADLINSIKIQELLKQEVYDKARVGPDEAKEYYKAHPEEFTTPEEVWARHILIKVPEDATEAQRDEALKTIEKAALRIQNGEAFAAVAKEASQDVTASYGGDLGYFARGRMVPEFEAAAFSLEKGQVSDIVDTKYGYHLIKVEDKRPQMLIPFEEVEQELRVNMGTRKAEKLGREYVENLKAQANIEIIQF